jgi:hypothetical protein
MRRHARKIDGFAAHGLKQKDSWRSSAFEIDHDLNVFCPRMLRKNAGASSPGFSPSVNEQECVFVGPAQEACNFESPRRRRRRRLHPHVRRVVVPSQHCRIVLRGSAQEFFRRAHTAARIAADGASGPELSIQLFEALDQSRFDHLLALLPTVRCFGRTNERPGVPGAENCCAGASAPTAPADGKCGPETLHANQQQ